MTIEETKKMIAELPSKRGFVLDGSFLELRQGILSTVNFDVSDLQTLSDSHTEQQKRIAELLVAVRNYAYCQGECPDGCDCCIYLFDEDNGIAREGVEVK